MKTRNCCALVLLLALSGVAMADSSFDATVPHGENVSSIYTNQTYNFYACADSPCQTKKFLGTIYEDKQGVMTKTAFFDTAEFPNGFYVSVSVSNGSLNSAKSSDVESIDGSYLSTTSFYPGPSMVSFDPLITSDWKPSANV